MKEGSLLNRSIIYSIILSFSLLTIQASPSIGQFEKYKRKSISFIDAVLVPDPRIKITQKRSEILLSKIKECAEVPRFDYNPLPDTLVRKFRRQVHGKNLSLDQVAELLQRDVAPTITRILDYNKELRALPDVEKERFIVQKAHELGITAEDLERVMNSAYIYVPVLTSLKIESTRDKEGKITRSTVEMGGGIAWFHLSVTGEQSRVSLYSKDIASAKESSDLKEIKSKKWIDIFKGKEKLPADPEEGAFLEAAATLAQNLAVKMKEHDEFKLCGPLMEITGSSVSLLLGRKEGLEIDDKLIIAEYYEDETGKDVRRNRGYVLVSHVGDNRKNPDNFSRAKGVIGSGFETGMLAFEHPRLSTDLRFGVSLLPLQIDSGYVATMLFPKAIKPGAIVGQANAHLNLAKLLKVPQFFLTIGLDVGGTKIDAGMFDEKVPFGWVAGFRFGLMKRHYLGRLALLVAAEYGFHRLLISKNYEDKRYSFTNDAKGAMAELGLEFALAIDLNLGLVGFYKFYPENDKWNFKIDGQRSEWFAGEGAGADWGGPGGSIYITYSPPSLPFDPFGWLR